MEKETYRLEWLRTSQPNTVVAEGEFGAVFAALQRIADAAPYYPAPCGLALKDAKGAILSTFAFSWPVEPTPGEDAALEQAATPQSGLFED